MISQRPRLVPVPANSVHSSRPHLQQAEDNDPFRGVRQGSSEGKGQHTITSAKDWTENDPENPQTWPLAKRLYHTAVATAFGFLCPYGSSVYTPGSMRVENEFGVSREIALLPFAFYLLELAFGPILAAPISETFGRRIVYLTGLPISALFTLGAGFSHGIVSLVVCRFFAGLFSSPGLSLGMGSVSDIWRQEERSLPAAIFVTSVQFGPAFGPVIGGFVVEGEGWRWTQWTMLYAAAFVIMITLGMSETYKNVILQRRARRLGVEGPPQPYTTQSEMIKYFASKTIVRPLHMLVTQPIVTALDVYVGFTFGLLNGFFAAFPTVFRQQYGFDLGSIGLTFIGQAVGSTIGCVIITAIDKKRYMPEFRRLKKENSDAKVPPEERLWNMMIGAPLLAISLFWFGWTARPSIHWISPIAAEAMFSCGNLLIFVSTLVYLADCFGAKYGASATSSNTFFRYLVATVFPLFANQLYEGLGVGWASSLLGFLAAVLAPIPFLFFRYGPMLRSRSTYVSGE